MRSTYKQVGGHSKLTTPPPAPHYELHGWHCTYHLGWCHNPLDCDLIPVWRLTPEGARIERELAIGGESDAS